MDALLRWWSQRAPRERIWLGAGGAVVAAALVYLIFIDPAFSGIARLERGLPAARAQAMQLDALLAEVNALKSQPQVAAVSAAEARAAIDKSLAAAGLKATRVQALSDSDLQLSFTNATYSTWTHWLAETERDLGCRTVAAVVNRATAVGQADIELTLRLARR